MRAWLYIGALAAYSKVMVWWCFMVSMNLRAVSYTHMGITPDWNMRNLTSDWIRTFLAKPVKTPGKKFEYDLSLIHI